MTIYNISANQPNFFEKNVLFVEKGQLRYEQKPQGLFKSIQFFVNHGLESRISVVRQRFEDQLNASKDPKTIATVLQNAYLFNREVIQKHNSSLFCTIFFWLKVNPIEFTSRLEALFRI